MLWSSTEAVEAGASIVPGNSSLPIKSAYQDGASAAPVRDVTTIARMKDETRQFPLIRLLDIILTLTVMVGFLFPLVAVAVLVKMQDGGSIFYGQKRLGKNGREFKCFKYRSMLTDADERLRKLLEADPQARAEWERDHKLKSDPRITKLGHILRKSSIDEFPQLWNVLKGEMSLVGPRPIVQAEIVKYGRSFAYYRSVKPGITGLWQVAGRNDVSYRRRVAMDRMFAKRKSVTLYLYILVMTIPAVLFQRGSY